MHVVFPLLATARSGGFRVICELASRLTLRGHRVTLLKAGPGAIPFPLTAPVSVVPVAGTSRGPLAWRRWRDAAALSRAVPRDAEAIVSTYYLGAYVGWIAARKRRALHVYFVQGYEPGFFKGRPILANRCKRVLAALTYHLPSRLVAVSGWIARELRRHTTRPVRVVSNGVDISVFAPSPGSRPDCGTPAVATLAWREPRKGLPDFIRAMGLLLRDHPGIAMLMASNDRALTVDAPFPVELEFPCDDAALARWYRRGTVFVSASHLEGFGLPVLEAMACGIPVVTTASGGVSDFAVDGDNCLMVPVADPPALAAAVARLLDDPGLRRRLAGRGLETARRLSWENTAAAFEQCLSANG